MGNNLTKRVNSKRIKQRQNGNEISTQTNEETFISPNVQDLNKTDIEMPTEDACAHDTKPSKMSGVSEVVMPHIDDDGECDWNHHSHERSNSVGSVDSSFSFVTADYELESVPSVIEQWLRIVNQELERRRALGLHYNTHETNGARTGTNDTATTQEEDAVYLHQEESTGTQHCPSIQLSEPDYYDKKLHELEQDVVASYKPSISKDLLAMSDNERPTVFMSYVAETTVPVPNFVRTLCDISRFLLDNGVKVHLDIYESLQQAPSINNWFNQHFTNSNFVILCISPSYKQEVESEKPQKLKSLHAKYIHNNLQTEYMVNGSQNERVIPLLCCGATQRDVPMTWRNTKVYQWHEDYQSLICRIFHYEMFLKPEIGPAPTLIRMDT